MNKISLAFNFEITIIKLTLFEPSIPSTNKQIKARGKTNLLSKLKETIELKFFSLVFFILAPI